MVNEEFAKALRLAIPRENVCVSEKQFAMFFFYMFAMFIISVDGFTG